MRTYDFNQVELKWQQRWDEWELYKVTEDSDKPKFYCLEMLPYPSGKLHMGHVRNYAIGDVLARFQTMHGYNVLHPMGWDAFGLPAENAAIQRGIPPAIWTRDNIAYMRKQLRRLGLSYDWSREIASCWPDYYRWTQWLFLQFYKAGLVYKADAVVNWCPSCATVLANEQVVGGNCERCDSAVEQKHLEQWFFRITKYADRLLDNLEKLEGWPEKVKTMQHNWIGRSEGATIRFPIVGTDKTLEVFTTRPDTVFGVTFMVLAPEHPWVDELIAGVEHEAKVREFIGEVTRQDEISRTAEDTEKLGVFTGRYCVNPLTGDEIPIWLGNYVLMGYGTGAIMAVPAHDQRDFEFAKKYDLPIRQVIADPETKMPAEELDAAFEAEGVLVNSGEFSGLDSNTAKERITRYLEANNLGMFKVQYRLRDWLISRQRYWGAPIPIVICDKCGLVPVPEEELPVLLPEDVHFAPDGKSPLAQHAAFVETRCPNCGEKARRETDTMDTFVCSSWYFLRYCDPHNSEKAFDKDIVDYWMPVDQYIGGVEHAILHLMYARFFTMVLHDLGLLSVEEPFTNLLTQGMVLKDGFKMSKSKGNVVDPDHIIERFGADTARLFILFAAPPERDLEWSESGVEGAYRFINRVWRLVQDYVPQVNDVEPTTKSDGLVGEDKELRRVMHQTLAKVTYDIERFNFNTAISAIMEYVNAFYHYKEKGENMALCREGLEKLVLMLAPFVPHVAEELWEMLGGTGSVHREPWPQVDEAALRVEEITIVLQVNGKVRDRVDVPVDISEEELKELVLSRETLAPYIAGKTVVKVIIVPRKLVNVVVK